jgi:MFS family permease
MADGLITPFISVYALYLGATKTLIGILTALPNFTNLSSQIFWGSLSDVTKRKKLMILAGGFFWAIFWIPIAFAKDPVTLIVLITAQAFLSAISVSAWTVCFMGEMPHYKRGVISGNINMISGIGSFVGTMFGGLLLNSFGFIPFLFFMVFMFGMISRIPFATIKIRNNRTSPYSFKTALKKAFDFSLIKKEKKLMSLIKTITFLNFAVSLAGPFLSVYVIQKLGGTSLDIAIITGIGAFFSILFYSSWGFLVDYLGRKTVMISCIIPISLIPFVYLISNNVIWLYLYSIISNVSWAGFNLASFAYLSDVIPTERSSYYVSVYNFITGLTTVIAPFLGGILADLFDISLVFMLSTVLRLFTFYFLDKLEEKTGLRPTGVFNFKFDYLGISYKLETFVTTYSLALYDFRKRSRSLISIKKFMKSLKKS